MHTPTITMEPSARFKRFKGLDCPILGPLTDSAIRKYALEGRYGTAIKERYERQKKERKARSSRLTLEDKAKQIAEEYL